MLKLRFVEVIEGKESIQDIENKEYTIIGHHGEIKPQLANGHISRKHCSVLYDEKLDVWIVVDGNVHTGASSKNGIYSATGEKLTGRTILAKNCERVYLLSILNAQAYLETFDDRVCQYGESAKSTLDLVNEIDIAKSRSETALRSVNIVQSHVANNREEIERIKNKEEEIEGKLNNVMNLIDGGLERVEEMGERPLVYFIGLALSFFTVLGFTLLWIGYKNSDSLIEYYLKSKGQQIEQKK